MAASPMTPKTIMITMAIVPSLIPSFPSSTEVPMSASCAPALVSATGCGVADLVEGSVVEVAAEVEEVF